MEKDKAVELRVITPYYATEIKADEVENFEDYSVYLLKGEIVLVLSSSEYVIEYL